MRISLSEAEHLNSISHKELEIYIDGSIKPYYPHGYVWELEGLVYYE